VPKIFLGESEGTNRATADVVMQEYVTRLRMLQQLMGEELETDLFSQLVNAKFGEGKEIPHIAWRPVWEPTLDVKAKYVTGLVQEGIILRTEARPQLGYPVQPSDEAIQAEKLLPPLPAKGVPNLSDSSGDDSGESEGSGDGAFGSNMKRLPFIPKGELKKGRQWLIAEVKS
jgi:hypothetical protein